MNIARFHFQTIDSTNTWAKANLHLFSPENLTLVTAEMQTEGRGRVGRRWISPAKQNLYATFCFCVPKRVEPLNNLSQILSVSASKALNKLGFKPHIKWPNDLLIRGKKISGILCETMEKENSLCMLAGIGINVNMPKEVLDTIDQPATSLMVEAGKEFELEEITTHLTEIFNEDLALFLEKGFVPFLNFYLEHLLHSPGSSLKVTEKGKILQGNFHSINPDGSLNLQLPTGELKKIYSGEIGL